MTDKPAIKPRILVVDDDRVTVDLLEEVLRGEGCDIDKAQSAEEGLARALERPYDVVVSDIRMVEMDGLTLLRNLRRATPETVVILITAFGSLESTIEAIREGAFDYLSKPFKIEEVQRTVRSALEQRRLLQRGSEKRATESPSSDTTVIVGSSRAMSEVYKTVARVAGGRTTVLLRGESGTGKGLVARAIHVNSSRASGPFLAVNLPSLPETLLESELFGHEKGAYTGATQGKHGLFEEASGGTLFLDEIGDTSLALQSKLLRAIEEQEIKRVGGNETIHVDVRVVVATNRDLEKMMRDGTFREDLYWRLNVVPIVLPALRERREDIPDLARHFLRKYRARNGKEIEDFTPDVMERLVAYPWPGNVRELEHVVERAVALNQKRRIFLEDLPEALQHEPARVRPTLDDLEREYIRGILAETKGSRQQAAAILGIDRKTLYRKILKYGLEDEGATREPPP
jgi:DNA-binding NtrC family response regulator